MQFTGKNLTLLYFALGLAIDELHNQVATCPNVHEYVEHIEGLNKEKRKLAALQEKVFASLHPKPD